jgi:PAS domain S-box-containing protein
VDQERISQALSLGAPAVEPLPLSLLGPSFEAAPHGLLVVDAQANVVAANSALLRMFGYELAGLIGNPLETLVPPRLRQGHRGVRDAYFRMPQRRIMGSGRELHARHASGQEFPVEIGLNPLPTPQGEMVLASVVDTSQRHNLETAFGRIFESATQGMVLVDAQDRIALLNERLAMMLGYIHADLVGRRLEVLLPERYRGGHAHLMDSYRGAPTTRSMGAGRDLTALHASGTELPVEIGLSAVRWQGQQMTLATVIDISVRRRIELELQQANENLREFTHVASHDLKSPLRGIADLVGWVREDLGDCADPRVVRNLDRIDDRVSRLDRLITDLLRYARSQAVDAECAQIDFTGLVAEVLRTDPPPESFRVDADIDVQPITAPRIPLETVLRNLLANAIRHHDGQRGHIVIEVRDDSGFCRIRVIDDGPGIALSAQPRVFRLFQTAGAADRAGSGMGLALTKRIVESHGGRIELSSPVSGDRGACFSVWWPSVPRRLRNA